MTEIGSHKKESAPDLKAEDIAMVLVARVHEKGLINSVCQIKNLMYDGEPIGDWTVRIERNAGPQMNGESNGHD